MAFLTPVRILQLHSSPKINPVVSRQGKITPQRGLKLCLPFSRAHSMGAMAFAHNVGPLAWWSGGRMCRSFGICATSSEFLEMPDI